MSNILITSIVGTNDFAIPTDDTTLDTATAELDALLSTVSNLAYNRVLAWVEDSGGPGGAEGVRSLNCLVETFTYSSEECPSESEVDTLTAAIESTLEADSDITSIGTQYVVIFTAANSTYTDVTTAVIVVGNSTNGDTSYECDYLDVGDGVQLQAALAAAGSGKDVYIRPGTYDLGAGLATAPLVVPADVNVRGAGREHVTVKTKASGIQGAFQLNADSILMDVSVDVALPTGACSGQTSVVLLNAANAEAHRVHVNFLGTYTSTQSGYSVLLGVFGAVTNSVEDAKLVDCTAGTKTTPVPSFVALGEALADALRAVYIPSSTSDLNVVDVRGLVSHGADIGIDFAAKARALDYTIYDAYRYGIHAHDTDFVSLTHGEINMVADQGDEVGILLDTLTDSEVNTATIIASTGAVGTKAVAFVNGDYNGVNGVRCSSGWQYGADLDSNSSNNRVVNNTLSRATTDVNDGGSLNEVAHNR
jgi:hypothetical protein